MTGKEKLIKFLQLKNEVIKKETNINYVGKEDVTEISSWDEDRCGSIYKDIVRTVMDIDTKGLSSTTCPWCVAYRKHCGGDGGCTLCNYGQRNGNCYNTQSLYRRQIRKAQTSFDILLSNRTYKNIIMNCKKI